MVDDFKVQDAVVLYVIDDLFHLLPTLGSPRGAPEGHLVEQPTYLTLWEPSLISNPSLFVSCAMQFTNEMYPLLSRTVPSNPPAVPKFRDDVTRYMRTKTRLKI